MTAMVFWGTPVYRAMQPDPQSSGEQIRYKTVYPPLAKAPRLAFAGGIVSLSIPGKFSKCKDILAIISCSIKAPSGA